MIFKIVLFYDSTQTDSRRLLKNSVCHSYEKGNPIELIQIPTFPNGIPSEPGNDEQCENRFSKVSPSKITILPNDSTLR